MKKFSLLLLTNLYHDRPEEDVFLAKYLENFFHVVLSHPQSCEAVEDNCDIILIRNIWNTRDYKDLMQATLNRFKNKSLKTYNALNGAGDMGEKGYLLDLFKKGFPGAIPTIDNLKDLPLLKPHKDFLIKPLDGADGIGIKRLKEKDLLKENIKGYIVQPLIDIEYEISFFYIDKFFSHALRSKNKRWKLINYLPSQEELNVAQKIADWNTLSYGIQRIDFAKTKDNKMLLLEVEDYCPYLSLLDTPEKTRNIFLKNLLKALLLNI